MAVAEQLPPLHSDETFVGSPCTKMLPSVHVVFTVSLNHDGYSPDLHALSPSN